MFVGCSIPTSGEEEGFEVTCDNGLIKGHAYSVTGLYEVVLERSPDPEENGQTKRLVKLLIQNGTVYNVLMRNCKLKSNNFEFLVHFENLSPDLRRTFHPIWV